MFLFCSFAKGNYHDNSDINIAIIVEHIEDDFFNVQPMLFKPRRQIDYRIEPVMIERGNDEAGFLEDIRETGIEILKIVGKKLTSPFSRFTTFHTTSRSFPNSTTMQFPGI